MPFVALMTNKHKSGGQIILFGAASQTHAGSLAVRDIRSAVGRACMGCNS